ncbi:transmembrane protein, putative [Bodo saltans]|uniref:Transmembrane protein, putative n=1 Tax=Bodo saltans TaxID=75058 RepID=A0A0S4JR18_BODSA|nr:transmembrane protein, putative [Bodo saltans]|eukprot:CUG92650.1 transmembrane protein, putative [Bodo saltans]
MTQGSHNARGGNGSDFTPIIRFAPPLSTLLRLNRDELPLMLANERVQLIYKDQTELKAIAMDHVDSPSSAGNGGKFVAPLNPKQAQTFAPFRTIPKHFDHVLHAVCHALHGDILRYNELVDALRIRFLGTDRAHNDSVKTKVKLESVLYALCESQSCTVDILVISPNRDSCSLYTKFTSHVLYEGEGDGFHAPQAPRTLVVLEFDSAAGTWSPVGYSIGNSVAAPQDSSKALSTTPVAAVAGPSEVGANNSAPQKVSVASRFMNALTRSKQPTHAPVSILTVDSSSDDEGSILGASIDGPRNFEAIVREADKIYHTNPYIEMQHGAAGGGPRGDVVLFQQRKPGDTGDDQVTVVSTSQSRDPQDYPFHSIRYPNLDMMDCGCCDLFVETANMKYFPSACVRLLVTLLFASAAAGLSIALLVLWWGDDHSTCCAHSSNPSVCWNQTSEAFLNVSTNDGMEAQCFDWMCPADGALQQHAQHAYFYGQALGPGQCLWLAIAGSLVCFGMSVAVNHFTIRFLALFKAKPRFMYWLSFLHICLAAALCAVCSYLLFLVVDLRRGTSTVVECGWYGANSVERGLCNDAAASQCVSVVAVMLPHAHDTVIFALAIALVACSGLHFLTSLIPTVPSEDNRVSIPHAIPDTAIFVPGIYAPDGATKEQIERLQLDMQLRAISGEGNRWDNKGGVRHGGTSRPLAFGKKPTDTSARGAESLKSRFANAMRKVRMQVATQRALRRASLETEGSTSTLQNANTHFAVHESGDRYMNSDARQIERKLSLTFKPRTNDQAHLSGATLRDVQRISKRIRDNLNAGGPPLPEAAWESHGALHRGREHPLADAVPVLDKYDHMEQQVEKFRHVTVVRDAVLDDIVERLGKKQSASHHLQPVAIAPHPEPALHPATAEEEDAFDQTRAYYPSIQRQPHE